MIVSVSRCMESLLVLVGLIGSAAPAFQAAVSESDREFAEHHGWIYNDLSAAMLQARQLGRPLMVVIRCPP